jgi:hypothetical protein
MKTIGKWQLEMAKPGEMPPAKLKPCSIQISHYDYKMQFFSKARSFSSDSSLV